MFHVTYITHVQIHGRKGGREGKRRGEREEGEKEGVLGISVYIHNVYVCIGCQHHESVLCIYMYERCVGMPMFVVSCIQLYIHVHVHVYMCWV